MEDSRQQHQQKQNNLKQQALPFAEVTDRGDGGGAAAINNVKRNSAPSNVITTHVTNDEVIVGEMEEKAITDHMVAINNAHQQPQGFQQEKPQSQSVPVSNNFQKIGGRKIVPLNIDAVRKKYNLGHKDSTVVSGALQREQETPLDSLHELSLSFNKDITNTKQTAPIDYTCTVSREKQQLSQEFKIPSEAIITNTTYPPSPKKIVTDTSDSIQNLKVIPASSIKIIPTTKFSKEVVTNVMPNSTAVTGNSKKSGVTPKKTVELSSMVSSSGAIAPLCVASVITKHPVDPSLLPKDGLDEGHVSHLRSKIEVLDISYLTEDKQYPLKAFDWSKIKETCILKKPVPMLSKSDELETSSTFAFQADSKDQRHTRNESFTSNTSTKFQVCEETAVDFIDSLYGEFLKEKPEVVTKSLTANPQLFDKKELLVNSNVNEEHSRNMDANGNDPALNFKPSSQHKVDVAELRSSCPFVEGNEPVETQAVTKKKAGNLDEIQKENGPAFASRYCVTPNQGVKFVDNSQQISETFEKSVNCAEEKCESVSPCGQVVTNTYIAQEGTQQVRSISQNDDDHQLNIRVAFAATIKANEANEPPEHGGLNVFKSYRMLNKSDESVGSIVDKAIKDRKLIMPESEKALTIQGKNAISENNSYTRMATRGSTVMSFIEQKAQSCGPIERKGNSDTTSFVFRPSFNANSFSDDEDDSKSLGFRGFEEKCVNTQTKGQILENSFLDDDGSSTFSFSRHSRSPCDIRAKQTFPTAHFSKATQSETGTTNKRNAVKESIELPVKKNKMTQDTRRKFHSDRKRKNKNNYKERILQTKALVTEDKRSIELCSGASKPQAQLPKLESSMPKSRRGRKSISPIVEPMDGTKVDLAGLIHRRTQNPDEFDHRILLIKKREELTNGTELKTERSKKRPGKGEIDCGFCNKRTSNKLWVEHLKEHYGIGWITDKDMIDVTSRRAVLSGMKRFWQMNKVRSMNCRICGGSYRSESGLLIHIERCGAPQERVVCEDCKKSYTVLSMPYHLRTCSKRGKNIKQNDTGTIIPLHPSVHQENDNDVSYNYNGRVKRVSSVRAQNKLKLLSEAILPDDGSNIKIKKKTESCDNDDNQVDEDFVIKHSGDESTTEDEVDIESISEGDNELTIGNHALKRYRAGDKKTSSSSTVAGVVSTSNSLLPKFKRIYPIRSKDPTPTVAQKWHEFIRLNYSKLGLYNWALASYTRTEIDLKQYSAHSVSNNMIYGNSQNKDNTSPNKKWKKLERYDTLNLERELLIYMGGKVKLVLWAPLPTEMDAQYLLVIYENCRTNESELSANSTTFMSSDELMSTFSPPSSDTPPSTSASSLSPSLITTASVFKLKFEKSSKNLVTDCKLLYSFLMPKVKQLHTAQFMPSGGYNRAKNRLGLLAVGTGQCTIEIYALPLKICIEEGETHNNAFTTTNGSKTFTFADNYTVLRMRSAFVLNKNMPLGGNRKEEGIWQPAAKEQQQQYYECNHIEWSEQCPHNHIFAAFSNGCIGIWDISELNNLNHMELNDEHHYAPINYFYCGETGITSMAIHYDSNGTRWLLLTTMNRRALLYELRNLLDIEYVRDETCKNFIRSMDWSPIWEPFVMGTCDIFKIYCSRIATIDPILKLYSKNKVETNFAVTHIHYNAKMNLFACATDMGHVVFQRTRELHLNDITTKQMLINSQFVSSMELDISNRHVSYNKDNGKVKKAKVDSKVVQEERRQDMSEIMDKSGKGEGKLVTKGSSNKNQKLFANATPFKPTMKIKPNEVGLVFMPTHKKLPTRKLCHDDIILRTVNDLTNYTRINFVRFNMNSMANGEQLIAVGFNNGFVRILNVKNELK